MDQDKEIVEQLLARGWKWGYVYGHGTDEPAGSGEFIIADVEKSDVLIPPDSLFKEPVKYDEYF